MLVKENRLTKRKEFGYIYKKGKSVYSKHLMLVFVPTKLKNIRVGFSVSKKVGKAHTRNLIKRRLRAIIQELIKQNSIKTNNYIFIANSGICDLTYSELKQQVLYLLKKENLLNE
jgi:ribonuclease P protein component